MKDFILFVAFYQSKGNRKNKGNLFLSPLFGRVINTERKRKQRNLTSYFIFGGGTNDIL